MHKLTEKDPAAGTGVCSVCGPVPLARKGSSWRCGNRRKQLHQAWRDEHPEQSKVNRQAVSAHKLTQKNPALGLGECPLCGVVNIVAYGRGYACENSPGAKRRQTTQVKPHERCFSCRSFHSSDNPVNGETGYCYYCSPGNSFTHYPLQKRPSYEERRRIGWESYLHDDLEMPIAFGPDPYVLDDQQPVHGWRVLGEGDLKDPNWKGVR